MTSPNPYAHWQRWLDSPSGRLLIQTEQAWLDAEVEDAFGYHAAQVVPPGLDALAHNRMPQRVTIQFHQRLTPQAQAAAPGQAGPSPSGQTALILADPESLPFADDSLDLLVLAHSLELVEDPHQLLREAARVLVTEGRLVVLGFNPSSLWRLPQPRSAPDFPPSLGNWVSHRRLKDWLSLLELTPVGGRFGLYRPVCTQDKTIARLAWMEAAGARWWPSLGALYQLTAIKRRTILTLRPSWQRARLQAARAAVRPVARAGQGALGSESRS